MDKTTSHSYDTKIDKAEMDAYVALAMSSSDSQVLSALEEASKSDNHHKE